MFCSCKAALLLLCTVVGFSNTHANTNKSLITEKVFGGQVASDKYRQRVANIVEFEDSSEQVVSICTGSILSKKWILTAAHCFYMPNSSEISASNYGIVPTTENTGATTKEWNANGIGAGRIFVHKQYDNTAFETQPYDIAVIELESEIMGTFFQPVRLGNEPVPGEKVMAVGYGAKKSGGPYPEKVQMTPLVVQSKEWCTFFLEKEYAKEMICSISENYLSQSTATNGLCSGDSGGPIFVMEGNENLVQYGVYSFGSDPCQVPYGTNFHVPVATHENSIRAIMETGAHSSFKILYESSGSDDGPDDDSDDNSDDNFEGDSNDDSNDDLDEDPNEFEESKSSCFPANAKVELENGTATIISALSIGDSVLVAPNMYSDVIMFTHQDKYSINKFIELKTEKEYIRLSPGHYIYLSGKLKAAREARIGDSLFKHNNVSESIVSVKLVHDRGLFNPQTMHGDIYINGFRTSTFTETVEPNIGNALLSMFRSLYMIGAEDVLRSISKVFA